MIRETETDEIKMTDLLELMEQNPIGARALGALISQLKRYEILHEVLRTSKFSDYASPCNESRKPNVAKGRVLKNSNLFLRRFLTLFLTLTKDLKRKMILDSMTLTNLEIIRTSSGSEYGSLIQRIDTCSSAGGKRRLREILVAPYSNIQAIRSKQKLIKGIRDSSFFASKIQLDITPLLLPNISASMARSNTPPFRQK